MERSANAPAEQNANPQSRMVAPGRGGRGVGNSEPTPEGRQSDDVDSESPAPPAQMMMRTADANEAGGNRENRAPQGRFYAVIDFDVQTPFMLNEQRAADFAGEDAAAEEQNDRRSEKNQDDLQLADATRPALPILLEQLGFVQVERLREKDSSSK